MLLIEINILSIIDYIDKNKNKIRRNARRLTCNKKIIVDKLIEVKNFE